MKGELGVTCDLVHSIDLSHDKLATVFSNALGAILRGSVANASKHGPSLKLQAFVPGPLPSPTGEELGLTIPVSDMPSRGVL